MVVECEFDPARDLCERRAGGAHVDAICGASRRGVEWCVIVLSSEIGSCHLLLIHVSGGRTRRTISGSTARASGDRVLPVDDGSARDLRAATRSVDLARQLTGLVPVAHRPDACTHSPFRKFHFREEAEVAYPGGQAVPRGTANRRRWCAPAGRDDRRFELAEAGSTSQRSVRVGPQETRSARCWKQ